MNKRVSVIIPCYNQEDYVADAINSVLEQTYKVIEIICVNDASPDNTLEVLSEFKNKYENIKIVDLKENGGLAHARNQGIENSTGKYILPLDADDKIAPTYIEKAVNVIEAFQEVGIVYCEAELFGAENGKWELPEFNEDNFIFGNCIFCTALFKKEDWLKAGKYNENMTIAWEDWDLWLSMIELGLKPYKIPEILFYYRKHSYKSMIAKAAKQYDILFRQIATNHPNLYLTNKEVIKRIFQPYETDIVKNLTGQLNNTHNDLNNANNQLAIQDKKIRKYKKLFNRLLVIIIIEIILIMVYILYMFLRSSL